MDPHSAKAIVEGRASHFPRQPDDVWTDFDINDLKRTYKENMEKGVAREKIIKILSIKLGIDESEVKQKMVELELDEKNSHTILVPVTIKQKYPQKPKTGPAIFDEDDDDRLKIKDHNLRAEQVQLQKDLLNENRKRGNDIVRAINNNTTAILQMEASLDRQNQNLEKLIQYIEDAIKSPKKKQETEGQKEKTTLRCSDCGKNALYARIDGSLRCAQCGYIVPAKPSPDAINATKTQYHTL